jgi:adenylate cyclase
MASGPALSRAGDWFGRPVNIASRITAIARPGSVLATREVRDVAGEAYRWSSAGARSLKGVDGPVRLYRARRAAREDEERAA